MEVFIRDEDKDKYESFAFSAYYHKYRIGEENTGKKNCLVQDFWSDDSEDLPKLSVKSLEQHDKELLREFADKLKDKIINENTNEQGNLDYNVDLTGLLDDINELLKERGVE